YATYEQWTGIYFLGCPFSTPSKQYISVGEMGSITIGPPTASAPQDSGDRFLTPGEVFNAVLNEVQTAPQLHGQLPFTVFQIGDPLLVHRMDTIGRDYYLAAVTDQTHTQVLAIGMVDGHFPSRRGLLRLPTPAKSWRIERTEIENLVIDEAKK